VRERQRGREAETAGADRLVQERDHRFELGGRGLVADAVGTHHVAPQRAVPDEEPHIEADAAVERTEVVGERAPAPRHAGLERGEGHALDLGHHAPEVIGVGRGDRREGKAAIPGDHARHTMEVRGAGRGIPEQLRVVVRMRVDDARRNHEPARVDRLGRLVGHRADRHDAAVADSDVGAPRGRTGPVDDRSALDHAVEHRATSPSEPKRPAQK
jgi:hypothetical protein